MLSKTDRYHVAHVMYREGLDGSRTPWARSRAYRIAAELFRELGDYEDSAIWAQEAEQARDEVINEHNLLVRASQKA